MPANRALSRRSACRLLGLGGAAAIAANPGAHAAAAPVRIVAAENFYGDIARQIGGDAVSVSSILRDPSQDPHLFEASPRVAREIAGARIAIYNGLGYDPWMTRLLHGMETRDRAVIDVGALTGRKPGVNPHIWYDVATMARLAEALVPALARFHPAGHAGFVSRHKDFEQTLAPIEAKIAALRARFAGTVVTATEPVFGYMFAALHLRVVNQDFQRAVMNNTDPSARQIGAFERSLKDRVVRLLVYNSQVSSPMATRMMHLAKKQGIPVIGVTETEPPGRSYQHWISETLDAVATALKT